MTKAVADNIIDCCKTAVTLEDRFIDLAFEAGDVQGMTPHDIKTYIRFVADWRLRQLRLPEVYGVKQNPLDWLQVLLSGQEHANFFEARSTEYSKAASKGRWDGPDGVWNDFARRPHAHPRDKPATRPPGYYDTPESTCARHQIQHSVDSSTSEKPYAQAAQHLPSPTPRQDVQPAHLRPSQPEQRLDTQAVQDSRRGGKGQG